MNAAGLTLLLQKMFVVVPPGTKPKNQEEQPEIPGKVES